MKKLFAVMAILLSSLIYGQEGLNSSIIENITFKPQEVFASGVLIMNYDDKSQIKYIIYKDESIVFEKEIKKTLGPLEEKMDLSTFENGDYSIRVFIESTEVKRIFFKKS